MLTAMDLADKGVVTGSGQWGGKDTSMQEAMQAQGWMPYSVKVGNRWYSYNRADPFGMTMGFAASIAEAIHKGEVSNDEVDEWQEVVAMSIAAISNAGRKQDVPRGVFAVHRDPVRPEALRAEVHQRH
jgi:hypothetical protein